MANQIGRYSEEQRISRSHEAEDAQAKEQQDGQASSPAYLTSLLGEASLKGRGNAPVRSATMLNAQQTHGNRAVQRVLQRSAESAASQAEEENIGNRLVEASSPAGGRKLASAPATSAANTSIQRSSYGQVAVQRDSEEEEVAKHILGDAAVPTPDTSNVEGGQSPVDNIPNRREGRTAPSPRKRFR